MPAFSRFLRYFVTVARVGSIRKASEELNISASAIDRQILLAEEQLGMALFERLPSGLRLTTAGEIMLDAAKGWNKDFETVRTTLENLRGLRRGHVRFAVIDALAKGLVPDAVGRLREDHPDITSEILVLENTRIAGVVTSGEVDFGIMLNPRPSKDLFVRAHAEIALGIVTIPGHPLAGLKSARFSVCTQYPLVAPGSPLALHEQIAGLQSASGIEVRGVVTSDNIQMIKSLVRQNIGISVLSWLDVMIEVVQRELAFVPIENAPTRPLTLALCIDPARQLSVAARLFLARMETLLSQLGERI